MFACRNQQNSCFDFLFNDWQFTCLQWARDLWLVFNLGKLFVFCDIDTGDKNYDLWYQMFYIKDKNNYIVIYIVTVK